MTPVLVVADVAWSLQETPCLQQGARNLNCTQCMRPRQSFGVFSSFTSQSCLVGGYGPMDSLQPSFSSHPLPEYCYSFWRKYDGLGALPFLVPGWQCTPTTLAPQYFQNKKGNTFQHGSTFLAVTVWQCKAAPPAGKECLCLSQIIVVGVATVTWASSALRLNESRGLLMARVIHRVTGIFYCNF